MKCIDACGYKHKPDNITVLTRHIEECLAEGMCGQLGIEPVVVWKDGEFTVVAPPKDKRKKIKEQAFKVELVKKEAVELTDNLKKDLAELKGAQSRKPNVTMGTISGNSNGGKKKVIVANLDEDLT